ncbi:MULTISPECIES: hypothetical protein [Clostridium]|uniref:Uncharacterized protein n=2 Tax=Clostridium TaxID=1485 RepID=A0A0G3WCB1_9CLOT|nr:MULTISPECIES: hypothetical protein [Clostridium]AKL95958.1 hypothetical protein CACET_c25130 [Clostridium aceticum]ARE88452.1 hypothetical protein CLFO_28550 [Clostridium formicaceticum]
MQIKSEYYQTWEEYKAENPIVSDEGLKADKIQNYEELMYKFIFSLFL